MIRVGCVNIDTSHPKAFAEYLRGTGRARYVAVYNDGFRGDDEVDAFVSSFEMEKRCSSISELVDMVDIGFIQSCNWENHLEQAMPFICRGKPVFIDKPIAGSLADCLKMVELERDGAVILGSSSVRYAEEIVRFANLPATERGSMLNVFGTAGVDEFNYGVHVVEGICGLINSRPVSCEFVGRSSIEGKTCETFFVRFEDGKTAIYNTFQGAWQPFEFVTMTTKTTVQFHLDTSKIYGALLDRICTHVETGKSDLAPCSVLADAVKVMLAGRISREGGSGEVMLNDIPENDPGYDGAEFEASYSAAASKLYLS